jgi:hypothetical protein
MVIILRLAAKAWFLNPAKSRSLPYWIGLVVLILLLTAFPWYLNRCVCKLETTHLTAEVGRMTLKRAQKQTGSANML